MEIKIESLLANAALDTTCPLPALFIINGDGKVVWTGHPVDNQVEIELQKIKDLK